MRKFLKVLISLAIIFFILRFVETGEVTKTLKLLSFPELGLLIVLYLLGQVVSAYKWHLINQELNFQSSFIQTVKAYFTGMFVNSYGLGIVGGDLTRALLVAGEAQKIKSLAGVFIDRVHGMLILGLIGCFSYLLWSNHFSSTIQYAILPLLVSFPCISLVWFFFPKLISLIIPSKIKQSNKFKQIINYYDGRGKHLLHTSLLSGLMHMGQFFLLYLIALFLGATIPFHTLLVVIPFVNIITSLPFSWNGLGVREASYIFFLNDYISNEQAVGIGLVWLVTVTINSLIGGIVSLFNKSKLVDS